MRINHSILLISDNLDGVAMYTLENKVWSTDLFLKFLENSWIFSKLLGVGLLLYVDSLRFRGCLVVEKIEF